MMRATDSVKRFWRISPPDLRRRLGVVYGILIILNLGTWIVIAFASVRYPILLGLGPTAYGFGLRHAVDPDHIAAIDNTTRKLMQDGKRPVYIIGLFMASWFGSVIIYKVRRIDDLDVASTVQAHSVERPSSLIFRDK